MPRLSSAVATTLCFTLVACSTVDPTLPGDPRARDTGAYPTFAAVPAAAAQQLSDAEARRERAGLDRAAARADRATPPTRSEVERLRNLRRIHEASTVARIEN